MINTILELYFSRFKCVRRYLGGVWVYDFKKSKWVVLRMMMKRDIIALKRNGEVLEDYRK